MGQRHFVRLCLKSVPANVQVPCSHVGWEVFALLDVLGSRGACDDRQSPCLMAGLVDRLYVVASCRTRPFLVVKLRRLDGVENASRFGLTRACGQVVACQATGSRCRAARGLCAVCIRSQPAAAPVGDRGAVDPRRRHGLPWRQPKGEAVCGRPAGPGSGCARA